MEEKQFSQICRTSLARIGLIFEFPTTDRMFSIPLYPQPLVFLKSRITVERQERILLSNRPSSLFEKSTPLFRNTRVPLCAPASSIELLDISQFSSSHHS
ncbi:unnamed protein product [Larinioides sclopetarius]|uniref:Uncharacterized protein n=1 Tax=Larinioides sclopetarius TaxID=280406 RepID=A0AAV2BYS9_9ARAC